MMKIVLISTNSKDIITNADVSIVTIAVLGSISERERGFCRQRCPFRTSLPDRRKRMLNPTLFCDSLHEIHAGKTDHPETDDLPF